MSSTKNLSRYDQCIKDINNEFEKNHQFVIYFNNLFEYYKQKFWKYIKERPLKEEFGNLFFPYTQQLFFEGYFIVDDYIHQTNTESIPIEFLEQPDGIIQQQSFDILNSEQGLEDIVSIDTTVEFEAWVLDNHEKTEQLLYEVKRDIILLGASYRFIKERERRNVAIKPEPEERIKGLLHRSDDLFFIGPQKYFVCVYTNPSTEVWSLFYWATLGKEHSIGSLTVQKFLKNDLQRMYQELPLYEVQKPTGIADKYLILTLILEEEVTDDELHFICSNLVQSIAKRQDTKVENIHLRISNTKRMLYFQTSNQ